MVPSDQIHNRNELKEIRQDLRNDPTPEEEKLWQHLKGKQLGYKIRRQHSVLNYVIDFYCAPKRLGIELDGAHHYTKEGRENDVEREEDLKTLEIKIIRFPNSMVRDKINEVLNRIIWELDNRK